jgi:hypothetical protein
LRQRHSGLPCHGGARANRRALRLGRAAIPVPMRDDARDYLGLFDARDHPQWSLDALAVVDLDREHRPQTLHPTHRDRARCDLRRLALLRRLPARASPRRRDRRPQTAVRSKTPGWRVGCIRGGGTSTATRATRPSGSSMMWVVPSR